MADATDLKSVGLNSSCGFESRHRHLLKTIGAMQTSYLELTDPLRNGSI